MSAERTGSMSIDHISQTPPNQTKRPERLDHHRQAASWDFHTQLDPSSQKSRDALLSPFSNQQYTHLPTPQSPSDSNRLFSGIRSSPESPVPLSQSSYPASSSISQRVSSRNFVEGLTPQSNPSSSILTPESSPFVSRTLSHQYDNPATPTNQSSRTTNNSRPSASQFTVAISPVTPRNQVQGQTGNSPHPVEQSGSASTLSSPFMAKAAVPNQRPRPSPQSLPARTEDIFIPSGAASASSSRPPSTSVEPPRVPGGEIERIRQAAKEEQLSQIREAESRRPEYLKRSKRSLDEVDPDLADEERRQHLVGIMESPQKGRRLKLFQETSEESFEESLMAGGYGRYRTADWVRQPQPIALPSGALPGANIVTQLEEVQDKPPSEKELKKQKRLEAFRSSHSEGRPKAKLYPVELEGKGRVLLDIPNEIPQTFETETPTKKRNNRRKKKGTELASVDKKALLDATAALAAEESVVRPNWPDKEFPWRLRAEERGEIAKAQEEERLKWIERFLDRDSDDEDAEVPPMSHDSASEIEESVKVPRMGRGKMVPLLSHPEDPRKTQRIKRSAFPTDPGDAKAALLAKRSVRALSYRQERRRREMHDDDSDMELCICRGVDDGRELVQCDGCQTWYHLHCIGIRSITELGKEEDPWFCRRCLVRSRSPSSSPEPGYYLQPASEPTFVPTEEIPHARSVDQTFFHQPSVQESPNWYSTRGPRTPTGPGRERDSDYYVSSSSSWQDMSRNPPTTPKSHDHHVKIYTNNQTPGGYDGYRPVYEESPFDPTSTPSRGIRFNAPYATPKTNVWPRPAYNFQTPMRTNHRSSRSSFGGPGSLTAILDDAAPRTYVLPHETNGRPPNAYDESPVRRNRSIDASASRRALGSPISARLLDESPVMRNNNLKGKDRSFDFGRGFV
ncbi:hypothetical protein FA15DRAFT_671919 [Coprinopsis marcescibilis]|uniref:PHD-type domain-containing protein n=1 Tax=Coprinopsis marcescibilis TaxID=230819 RepID=A0A5C3L1E3_COPMA|nr:hypothetical protein FA15DRAFT_671919 [Coprinopsis marcescibilis]